MDVIIMPSIALLLDKLTASHPGYTFSSGDHFRWAPSSLEITYDPADKHVKEHTLHELAHALLDHNDYDRDIQLITMERDAWQYAKEMLGPEYKVIITDTTIQNSLDTYRDWLHARSTCPNCHATGMQHKKQHYRCVACQHTWRVNDARVCGLRRYSLHN
jgi:predicted RecB family nuclease